MLVTRFKNVLTSSGSLFPVELVALGFVRLTNIKFSHEFDVYRNVWSKLVFVSPDGLTINYRL